MLAEDTGSQKRLRVECREEQVFTKNLTFSLLEADKALQKALRFGKGQVEGRER